MSIPAYALSTCNERNHNLDDSLKDAMCSKCQTWANEKYIGRNVGKNQRSASKRKFGCVQMMPSLYHPDDLTTPNARTRVENIAVNLFPVLQEEITETEAGGLTDDIEESSGRGIQKKITAILHLLKN